MNVKKTQKGGKEVIPTRDPMVPRTDDDYWVQPDPSKPQQTFLVPDFRDTWRAASKSWLHELCERIRGAEGRKYRKSKIFSEEDLEVFTDEDLTGPISEAYDGARRKFNEQKKDPGQKALAEQKGRVRSRKASVSAWSAV